MTLKELFATAEDGTLTFEQFETAAKQAGAKFIDLSEGEYVSKHKHEDELAAKDAQINTLNETISNRDTDLKNLGKQLETAGTDVTKLKDLESKFNELQKTYKADTANYKQQLENQAYEFAVKEFANNEKFSSNAAKRQYISEMVSAKLKMDEKGIIGGDDFLARYKESNADSFVIEQPAPAPEPPKPTFVQPTGQPPKNTGEEHPFNFNFSGFSQED